MSVNAEYEKLKQENQFLKQQHRNDLKALSDYRNAVDAGQAEVAKAFDLVLAKIASRYGEPVTDDDTAEIIGYRLEIPARDPDAEHMIVRCEAYDSYVGNDCHRMYRIGAVIRPE